MSVKELKEGSTTPNSDRINIAIDEKIAPKRCPSQASTASSDEDICRICHWEGDSSADALVAPCYCAGSLRYVHQRCLQQWIKSSDIRCCELCKFQFVMNTKLKSFNEWECLQLSDVEKKKLVCNIAFHCIALTCVLWSLYVLIERAVEELDRGAFDWPFWTKLVVVAFGLFGVAVFKYIQCKAYFSLCRRWRAFNRVIYIQDAPEKTPAPAKCPPASPGPAKATPPPSPSPLVNPTDYAVNIPPIDPEPPDPDLESGDAQESQDPAAEATETHALLHV